MKYKIISLSVCCILFFSTNKIKAQEKSTTSSATISVIKEPFDVFYRRADSLNIASPTLKLNAAFKTKLRKLDESDPYELFEDVVMMYQGKPALLDEIATTFTVALIRYVYYLGVNPNYPPSERWIFCESFKQNHQGRINLYLQNNPSKYKAILEYAINYCNNNEYSFYKGSKNAFAYKKAIEPHKTLLSKITSNTESYTSIWQKEKEMNLKLEAIKKTQTKLASNRYNIDSIYGIRAQMLYSGYNDSLWTLIETEWKVNPNSIKIDSYLKLDSAYHDKQLILSNIIQTYNTQKLEEDLEYLKALNDTSKKMYKPALKILDIETAKTIEDQYDYYNGLSNVKDYDLFEVKIKMEILNYIKQKNWDEKTKSVVFNLGIGLLFRRYDYKSTTAGRLVTRVEQKEDEINELKYFESYGSQYGKISEKIIDILGKVEGTLTIKDLHKIKNKDNPTIKK